MEECYNEEKKIKLNILLDYCSLERVVVYFYEHFPQIK